MCSSDLKSYWNTLIFLISAVVNIALCYALIPLFADAGAAMAAAGAALVALGIRTAAGEKYYKAIDHYRYLYYAVGLMLAASVINYALRGSAALKYGLLALVYALALYLFRREIRTLLLTARQLLTEGAGVLKRRAASTHNEGDAT